MPNHVTNIITITNCSPERKKEITLSILNSVGNLDFNKVIPMPDILVGTNSPNNTTAEECKKATGYTDWYSWSIDAWGSKWNAYQHHLSYTPVGFKKWHQSYLKGDYFSERKMRCYPDRIDKKRFKKSIIENGVQELIQFQTAWSIPEPIFIGLSKKYPDATFEIQFADEDTGSNCGTFSVKNGLTFDIDIAPNYRDQTEEERKRWTKFAFELNNPNVEPASYGYGEDWVYSEDVEEAWDKKNSEIRI